MNAIIVTYNPSENFEECLESISSQFDTLIVDNNSKNINYIKNLIKKYKFNILCNEENFGIAKALNLGVDYLNKNNKLGDYFLVFDQDTIISKNYKKVILSFIDKYKLGRVGIINTKAYHAYENINKEDINEFNSYNEIGYNLVDEVISSGSAINSKIYFEIGRYDEKLFVDLFDNEFCLRTIINGYKIIEIDKKFKIHSLGNIKEFNIFNKKFYVYNQSPIRYYYRVRNTYYLIRKYKNNKDWCLKRKKQLRKDILKIFFEKNKLAKIRMVIKGFKQRRMMT